MKFYESQNETCTSYADIRKKYGLTQQRLHDLTGIPLRTIEEWSAGNRRPPEYVIELLDYYLSHNI